MIARKQVELLIKENYNKFTRQQIKTIKGQLNSSNIEGAYKGVNKIINKYNKLQEEAR